jgi:hypothetical protein
VRAIAFGAAVALLLLGLNWAIQQAEPAPPPPVNRPLRPANVRQMIGESEELRQLGRELELFLKQQEQARQGLGRERP